VKKAGIAGFLFGCFAPLLLFGIALQGPEFFGRIAQKFIEFTYMGVKLTGEPFGMLNAWERVMVVLLGGVLWAMVFMGVKYIRNRISSSK